MTKKNEEISLNQIPATSKDVRKEMLDKMREIYPALFGEGDALNAKELQALVDDYSKPEVERYAFPWTGKTASKRFAFTPSKARLVPDKDRSVDFDTTQNLIIEGENLEVLKLLQSSYFKKVKMIYIDPPYNTGHDFVYPDDYSESKQAYWEKGGVMQEGVRIDTNSESSGRYHSNWLSMMQSRLLLARNLLRDDGVIFVSIDDNEAHNLRKLMDEVFGEENFVADIVVVNNLKGRNDKRYIATAHERLMMYVKTDEFQESGLALTEARLEEYDQEDDSGKYRLLGLRKRGGADTREQRPKMFFPLYVNPANNAVNTTKEDGYSVEVWPRKSDNSDGCWRWGFDTISTHLDWLLGKSIGDGSRFDVFEKDYLETEGEIKRMKPKSVMYDKRYSTDAATKAFSVLFPETDFNNPKSVPFLTDLIAYSTTQKGEDIVLDFFAGSGTTGHATIAANLQDKGNRKFVLVQLSEEIEHDRASYRAGYKTISEITIERVKRAGAMIKAENPDIDTGFKTLRLAKSLFPQNMFEVDSEMTEEEKVKAWETYLEKSKQAHLFDFKPDELLAEIALMDGFDLNFKAEPMKEFKKNKVLDVSDGEKTALVCLDESIHDETIKALETFKERRLICLERSVDSTRKWNLKRMFGDNLWVA